jgi:hypothetical protein
MRQQAGMILIPCIAPPCAISSQHAGRALDCIASTQADAGIAVHETTAASINNATFLPQCIVIVSSSSSQYPSPGSQAGVSSVTPRKLRDRDTARGVSFLVVFRIRLLGKFSRDRASCFSSAPHRLRHRRVPFFRLRIVRYRPDRHTLGTIESTFRPMLKQP